MQTPPSRLACADWLPRNDRSPATITVMRTGRPMIRIRCGTDGMQARERERQTDRQTERARQRAVSESRRRDDAAGIRWEQFHRNFLVADVTRTSCRTCVTTRNILVTSCIFEHDRLIGSIPWGHSGPLCHALSLSTSHAACSIAITGVRLATPGDCQCNGGSQ